MENKVDIYFLFLELLMNELKNKKEIEIAKTIMKYSANLNEISIKDLAQLSNNSTASITRFVKKFPVNSYKEFTHRYVNDFRKLDFAKKMHYKLLLTNPIEKIIENKYVAAKNNIHQTFKDIKLNQLEDIIQTISQAKSITIIGANHSLEIFSKLQIILNIYKIPTFIFKQKNKLKVHLNTLSHDDLVIFVCVEGRYQRAEGNKILEDIKDRNIQTIMFTQTRRIDFSKYDTVVFFGVDLDVNIGYFSLMYIVEILCEMIKYKIK